jgi:hypothetical protein
MLFVGIVWRQQAGDDRCRQEECDHGQDNYEEDIITQMVKPGHISA